MSTNSSGKAISLENVGKRYRQYGGVEATGFRKVTKLLGGRAASHDMWALKDISFDLETGSTLGVIGRNGSGKTTLLRMLSGVSAPTVGRLRVVGRIAPLIGVGVGFNPELSGRENVFVNGRLMGMSDAQLKRDYDSIVAFSEIEDFIETPVKFYSSGMFLRLAFAVIVHMEPEILVVDEVLAVGDMAFQLKCNDRIRAIREDGSTIVIVTHNLQILPRMTERIIVLSHGEIRFDGPVEDALGIYQQLSASESESASSASMLMREGPAGQQFLGGANVSIELSNEKGVQVDGFGENEPIHLRLTAEFVQEVKNPLVGVLLAAVGRGALGYFNTQMGDYEGTYGPGNPFVADIVLENPFLSGGYMLTAGLFHGEGHGMLGSSPTLPFHVTTRGRSQGLIDLRPKITIAGEAIDFSVDKRNLLQ